MQETIFVPAKIRVGYQERSDTYTKMLAYVIYYDQKGVLRKEKSWESWRSKKIDPTDFNNVPTSGFVLNKKVGDYTSDWNHRMAYVRVYDPRGFEFEINIENLLYILENANSIKGKGLEGEFVYGWHGTDLVLIPTESPDYVKINAFTTMVTKPESIKSKDLVPGRTYRTNKNEDWIYLGRFEKYSYPFGYTGERRIVKNEGPHYVFSNARHAEGIRSISGRIVKTVSTDCSPDYAELMDKLAYNASYTPVDFSKDEYVTLTDEEIDNLFCRGYHSSNIYFLDSKTGDVVTVHITVYSKEESCQISYVFSNGKHVKYEGLETGYYRSSSKDRLKELHQVYQFKKFNQYLKNGNSLYNN